MDTYTRRIPQPMKGMNWQPSPSDYTSIPPPSKYGDTDFANDDFAALWGASGRNDLQTIKDLGCNTINMYNMSQPAPNGYFMRNHKSFLGQARTLGLSVIYPISNYFVREAYKDRTNQPSNPPVDVKSIVFDMVAEVYADGTPGSVVMWAIGNQYDLLSNLDGFYFEASDIATVASYVMDAESKLLITPDKQLVFTSPVSTAITPNNQSIPQSKQLRINVLEGGRAINALIDEFTKRGIQPQRFIAGVNSFQVGQQLIDYFEAFPKALPNVSMFYGELGWSAANGGEGRQAENIKRQFLITANQAQKGSYFFGACCFEFSDELWKGQLNSSETKFGIYTFTGQSKQNSNEGNHSPVWGAQYPVDVLVERPAVTAFRNAGSSSVPTPAQGGDQSNDDNKSGSDVSFDKVSMACLDEDNLADLMDAVVDLAARWKSLGMSLRIRPAELDSISLKNLNDPNGCLRDVIHAWLQQHYDTKRFGQPSWKLLCHAVHKPAGGDNPALARKIAGEHS